MLSQTGHTAAMVTNCIHYLPANRLALITSRVRTNNTCLPKATGRFKKQKLKGTNDSALCVMRIS